MALVPETVGKLARLGLEVTVQAGAGEAAYFSDAQYAEAGAVVLDGSDEGLASADVVASVRPLGAERASRVKPGAIVLSFLQPNQPEDSADAETIAAVAEQGATALSFDLVPRISRAQSMDALTSQALVTGYRAVLVAAAMAPKFFPLFMTAAGTIPPAKVLVLGAGVAGLDRKSVV